MKRRAEELNSSSRRAVKLRAVKLRAVKLRAVKLRAVKLRAVKLRAVKLRAVKRGAVNLVSLSLSSNAKLQDCGQLPVFETDHRPNLRPVWGENAGENFAGAGGASPQLW